MNPNFLCGFLDIYINRYTPRHGIRLWVDTELNVISFWHYRVWKLCLRNDIRPDLNLLCFSHSLGLRRRRLSVTDTRRQQKTDGSQSGQREMFGGKARRHKKSLNKFSF